MLLIAQDGKAAAEKKASMLAAELAEMRHVQQSHLVSGRDAITHAFNTAVTSIATTSNTAATFATEHQTYEAKMLYSSCLNSYALLNNVYGMFTAYDRQQTTALMKTAAAAAAVAFNAFDTTNPADEDK